MKFVAKTNISEIIHFGFALYLWGMLAPHHRRC